MGAPVLQTNSVGFPAQYASKIANLFSNQQGDNAYVTAASGDCLIAVAIGLKSLDPFDQLHSSHPTLDVAYFPGLTDFMPSAPTISDNSVTSPPGGNSWVLEASYNLQDADYTVITSPPVPTVRPSALWNLDGYFPSIYIWIVTAAAAGTYAVNLNSMYRDGITRPGDLAAGKPIFDGGVDFFVTKFTGMTGTAADGNSSAISSANPAVSGAITTTGTGDLVFAVGLQKSANGLGLGPTDGTLSTQYARVADGKLVGSEAHYLAEWGIQTSNGAWTPKFANPLGYETLVAAVALKHS